MTDTSTDDEVVTTEPAEVRRAALEEVRAAVDSATDDELVEQRSADSDATRKADKALDGEHVKVFVVPPGSKPDGDYDHEPNAAATLQYMMSQGLRPTGDVRYLGAEPFGPGGKSWALTYAVPAVPAERFDFAPVYAVEPEADPAAPTPEAVPTMDSTRDAIDEYAKRVLSIDTTQAANKAAALALYPSE